MGRGDNVGSTRQSVSDVPAGYTDGQQCTSNGRGWSGAVFSVVSGAVALVVGAAASLLTSGSARVAVWCAVSGSAAVVAGVVRELVPFSAYQAVYRRCRHWLDALSSFSLGRR
jgi:hypothetical protein